MKKQSDRECKPEKKAGFLSHRLFFRFRKQRRMTEIYEIPDSVIDLFVKGEAKYRIISYEREMDNIQSMRHFLECIGATEENIYSDDGTQVVLKHPDRGDMFVIDAGGLGDFFSHGFDVTEYVFE